MEKQIFYDTNQKRHKYINLIWLSLAIFFVSLISILIFSLLKTTYFSKIKIDTQNSVNSFKPVVKTISESEYHSVRDRLADIIDYAHGDLPTSPPITNGNETIAFLVNWDRGSFDSLKTHLDKIDILVPEWYTISAQDLSVSQLNQTIQASTHEYLKLNKPTLPLVPIVNNFNSESLDWDTKLIHQVLINPKAQDKLITALLSIVRQNNFQGITLDLENIIQADQSAYSLFLEKISQVFHESSLLVYVALPPANYGYDYAKVASHVDKLIFMDYDEHWSTSKPGPIASFEWFHQNLAGLIKLVDPKKISLAIGAYGYDWIQKSTLAKDLTYSEVIDLSRARYVRKRSAPRFDTIIEFGGTYEKI